MGKCRRIWVACLCIATFAAFEAMAASRPMNPFGSRGRKKYRYQGSFHMSDGVIIEGPCRLKGRKVFKIFDRARGRHREFPLSQVAEVDCKVTKEWMEKIWRWKEEGEHVKIDTGQSYPVREFEYTLKLRPDEDEDEDEAELTVTGGMSGVIFVETDPRDVRHRDVYDWQAFCGKLKAAGAQDTPSPAKRLWSLMPEKVHKLIELAANQMNPLRETRYEILDALDAILKRRDFYRKADFAGTVLPDKAKEMLARKPTDLTEREVQQLNRVLVSAIFPRALARPRKREEKLWYNSEVGDKTHIGDKLEDIVYIQKMVFTSIGKSR